MGRCLKPSLGKLIWKSRSSALANTHSFSAVSEIESLSARSRTLDRYTVCTIITHGSASDLSAIPSLIAKCAGLPVSIVMIYVGKPGGYDGLAELASVNTPVLGEEREVCRVVDFKWVSTRACDSAAVP